MRENRDQLEQLLRCFYDEEQTLQAASEIEAGESLLETERPLPRSEVLVQIKQLLKQRAAVLSSRRRFYRRILTASAACLAAAITLMWSIHQRPVFSETSVVLQVQMVQDFFSDDAVSDFSSTLDGISEEIYTGYSDAKSNSWESEVGNEIDEMVLIAQADFWKG